MATDPFAAKSPPSSVTSEFQARADGTKLLQWTAKRFPWMYVISCSGECDGKYKTMGTAPGVTPSLLGGSPSNAGYDTATYMPLPNVKGIDVKALGSLGTTRKASIKFDVYTDEQLIEVSKCYFIPGMDVRCEWGWNESCDGSTPPAPLDDPSIPGHTAVCRVNARRHTYSSYDGFHGIVTNFKYSLNASNVWECELEVISAADPFNDSKADPGNCPCAREVETEEEDAVVSFGPVFAMIADLFEDFSGNYSKCKSEIAEKSGRGGQKIAKWYYEGTERTATGEDKDGSWYSGMFTGEESYEPYLSFGTLIDIINTTSIPGKDGKFPYGKIDCDGILLPSPGSLKPIMSADPRVCFIPGGWMGLEDEIDMEKEDGDSAPSAITFGENGVRKVILENIMVNGIWFNKIYKQVIEGDGKLKTLIDNLLSGINRVCGDIWSFTTISTSDTEANCESKNPTGPTITILDERTALARSAPFEIPSTVGDSTLRGFNLALKMSGAMKTQALYAGNKPNARSKSGGGGEATGCEGTAVAAFYSQGGGYIKNLAKPEPESQETSCLGCDDRPSSNVEEPTYSDLADDLYYDINDQTAGAMLEWLKGQLGEGEDKELCAGVPLPFDFSFDVDGIGGFEFGQIVSSNRIPAAVRANFRWQITKVEHSITVNDWQTKVSTVCRSNPYGEGTFSKSAKSGA